MQRSRRCVIVFLSLLLVTPTWASSWSLGKVLDKIGSSTETTTRSLSDDEVTGGLKQALSQSVDWAVEHLGQKNGFWSHPDVRIPLPSKLDGVASLMRRAGQGDKVDTFEESLNHAAEKAVPEVSGILKQAVQKLTVKDARRILTGDDHALTTYFRKAAGPQLMTRIRPIVHQSMDNVGVTRQYQSLTSQFQKKSAGSMLSKWVPAKSDALNLDNYVTDKAVDALFTRIGQEEADIRAHPVKRTTALIKKVFAHQ